MANLPKLSFNSVPFRMAVGIMVSVAICTPAEAGNILRAGGSVGAPSQAGAIGGAGTTTTTAQIGANTQNILARTTQALQDVQVMQSAARAAAVGVNHLAGTLSVPNGLVIGNGVTTTNGLVPLGGVPSLLPGSAQNYNVPASWSGVGGLSQSSTGGQTTVNVTQNAQNALLNWTSFNIGTGTTLNFDQSNTGALASESIAFNKVNDPSGVPSQILGSITAQGQVYVINQNGIIFGGASQVNTHALVASSLPIDDNLISRGLLNNPDAQFLFSALPQPAGNNGPTPAFTPPTPNTSSGKSGDVVIKPGAEITSPTTADHVGGRVALIGPNVTNGGTISTPDGQTILAAGLQVGFAAHDSNDASLRGLDVFVGSVDPTYSGVATNNGLIDAPRADITMAGMTLNQNGVLNSTTSVSLNGRIDLLANYNAASSGGVQGVPLFLPKSTGTVTLGMGSVTQILPESSSTDRVVGSQLALPSIVDIQGLAIHMESNAALFAPGAALPIGINVVIPVDGLGFSLASGISLNAGNWFLIGAGVNLRDQFVYTNGQIYLDAGASINAAGSEDITASVAENIISAKLLGAELANSPLQRDGALRGQSVQVDILQSGIYNGQPWVGTPLADLRGYVNLVQRTVGELTANGGSVSFKAGGSVVMQPGATIDVSGGWINYQGATVQTSKVISNGHVYDISRATPDIVYDGVFTGEFTVNHAKWGISETYNGSLLGPSYEQGFIQGGNGGTISITAPSMALDGSLLGNTVTGPRQREIMPLSSTLSLQFKAQQSIAPNFLNFLPTPPSIIFQSDAMLAPADPFALDGSGNPLPLRSDRQQEVILSPSLLTQSGFGNLQVDNSDDNFGNSGGNVGNITIPANVTLNGTPGGSLILNAANIDVEGSINIPGGNISLTAADVSPSELTLLKSTLGSQTPPPNPARGNLTLASTASLITAGLIVDDRVNSSTALSLPLVTAGGTVKINSYNADLAPGSTIDVSGGVAVSTTGKFKYGAGGTVGISAGQDLNIGSVLGGKLVLESKLKGYSGGNGGTLSIQAPQIQIGGAAANTDTLVLSPDFFSQGGFASFNLIGLGAATAQPDQFLPTIAIEPGTVIAPQVQNWLAMPDPANGNNLVLAPSLLPEGVRPPVSITFNAPGVTDAFTNLLTLRGDIFVGVGSVLQTDPGGSIALNGNTVSVLGSFVAPGGGITLTGANSFPTLDPNPINALPTVYLGPASLLSAVGATVLTADARGYRTGSVFNGGNIAISGNIAAVKGSVLNVSGASDVLDMLPAYSGASPVAGSLQSNSLFVPTRVDSNGGKIALNGAQEMFMDAALIGNAGGPSAVGGSLFVKSGRFYSSSVRTTADINLIVTQNGPTIPVPAQTGIGRLVTDASNSPLPQFGHISVDDFQDGGFATLTLGGNVRFSGPVAISAKERLSVGTGGVIYADSTVNLTAPYVALGQVFQLPVFSGQQPPFPFTQTNAAGQSGILYNLPPTFGPGNLTVTADLVDVGNLSLQNIGTLRLFADNGDIRGDGTLDIAGDVTLRAGQVYPATAVSFTIAAYDHNGAWGSVTIEASGSRQLPLSAAGELNIYGSIIQQGGVLRAPFGVINLGWNGQGSAPSDLIAGNTIVIPSTQTVVLSAGSMTSVSAVDPATGQALIIPYGINLNGTSWIDPTGMDITAGGAPGKSIRISGANVTEQSGATLDIRGGGDLFAYRWVSGLGGNSDILASSSSFAVIPGYQADYAPYAPYNTSLVNNNFGSDPGYVNGSLNVGDQVYLSASSGLPAGVYTLLPARYALLPGGFLVTPQNGVPGPAALRPDGSSLVAGYRFNGMDSAQTGHPLYSSFEVDPQSVVLKRAEYDSFSANSFLRQGAIANNAAVPRLPMDAGYLAFNATQTMNIQGSVLSTASGGRGGIVDISSPVDIWIVGPNGSAGPGLVLNASSLNSFSAESLLIGGVRQEGSGGATVAVATNNITVDNAGTPLVGSDIILAANKTLTLAAGADVEGTGAAAPSEAILLGNATAGSGDGVLLRVSSDPTAQIARSGVDSSTVPKMSIGAGTRLGGAAVILDSTYATSLDPGAVLNGESITLDSGQISIQLNTPGSLYQPTQGLILSGGALQTMQASAHSLSLLSYSSIDIYGAGQVGSSSFANLALHAGEIRGFNNGGGSVTFAAQAITLDNSANGTSKGAVVPANGTLVFNAGTIQLGVNQLAIDQYSNVSLNANGGLLVQGAGGGLSIQNNLSVTAPLITGAAAANQTITAGGAFNIQTPAGNPAATITGGLGANLVLTGARITENSIIQLPSGVLSLHTTTGDISIGGTLDVGGTAQVFFDLIKYTDAGQISLIADNGSVSLTSSALINVAAQSAAGNAGTLAISTPTGSFNPGGMLAGLGGVGGQGGSFSLDAGTLPGGGLTSLASTLTAGGFTRSISIRDRNDSLMALNGEIKSNTVALSTDAGSMTIAGTIDAHGVTGGTINLDAHGSVTLLGGSELTVAALNFNDAGKGGAVTLEAGDETNGSFSTSAVVDIQTGSTIDLSVASNTAGSAALGDFTGTLHLRAPQNAASTDLQVNPINGSILNASAIVLEGYKLFDLTSTGGAITSTVETNVKNNGIAFVGAAGTTTANYTAMLNRLFANNVGLVPLAVVEPGAEIINRTGALTLASDWNLSTYRFGPKSEAGVLTLRAAGNLVFNGALSDGFTGGSNLWLATLMPYNPLLPANSQSWSYRLTAGADFAASNFNQVKPLAALAANSGSLLLGVNGVGTPSPGKTGANALTSDAVKGHYQVIRTGSGDIDIATGRDVQLLNQFATIYTAGVQVPTPTSIYSANDFNLPKLTAVPHPSEGPLGSAQQDYPAQYSMAGGNVSIAAQQDVARYTQNTQGNLIADSSRELPTNWLYRRGYVDPLTGQFGASGAGTIKDPAASTTWWVDFSNFFEGVGALGGGNVTMTTGRDISNVDAVVSTNARMPKGTPDASKLLELGGGDLLVQAGRNINGGVYYVERGKGTLAAGNSIMTNSTRSPSLGILVSTLNPQLYDQRTWLPTTLFLGVGSFNVSASGDVLLGPTANPFLLPSGINNEFWYKTYFSTYSSASDVDVSSLGGNVTFRLAVTLPGEISAKPILQAWMQQENVFNTAAVSTTASTFQPWLRLDESSVEPFATVSSLMPPELVATAFSGSVNVVGSLTLFPSPTGSLDFIASGAINGLQANGVTNQIVAGQNVIAWSSAQVNLSDADPTKVPGIATPLAYQFLVTSQFNLTIPDFLISLDDLFNETGSTQGAASVLQTKQALHDSGLHVNDPNPIHLYAQTGDISGLTLFSGEAARIVAGLDITDIGLYVQNNSPGDVSIVAAGRDIVAYDATSPLRVASLSAGNSPDLGQTFQSGDIQISGPGTLEVLAGRNLNLGAGPTNSDGTALGIVSIGNERNPYLPFEGADIIAGAGIGSSYGLGGSHLDFASFISQFVTSTPDTATGGHDYLSELGGMLGNGASVPLNAAAFSALSAEQQDIFALDIFYLVLRDAGRDHNDSSSPGFKNYSAGTKAISALFPGSGWQGDVTVTGREIKTANGGDISVFVPGGQLTVGLPVNNQPVDQGILTAYGGNINIFTDGNVTVGTSRIFTLRGGNEIIWSSDGNIAAGAAAKTVQSAPPTRVLIDPQSADVRNDLSGLATGGGIGVLDTVAGVPPGDVDLIAPTGTIDAGDAGIRATGNLNVAAVQVLNASNIQVSGASNGTPTTAVEAPNISGLTAASSSTAAGANAANDVTKQATGGTEQQQTDIPSIITVEVLGYGGG